jgi:mono/diheme cytochrome c family protein
MIQRVFLVAVFWSISAANSLAAEAVDFAAEIEPIFAARCAKCHGEAKAQAKLRLDSIAALEERITVKPQLVVAGKPDESLLYQRLVLPADNPKRMPKGGEPLPQEQVALVAEWIKQGASFGKTETAPDATAAAAPEKTKTEPKKVVIPDVAPAAKEAVDQLVAAGARVTPLFAGSNLLEVSFAAQGEPAADADVAEMSGVAEQVYTLNLANAKITAAGLAPLAGLKHLTALHLEHSTIDDEAIRHLSGLASLEYLNLYGTSISDAGLEHLKELKQLRNLYLWQTKVSYDAAMSLEKEIPGLVVNLGYDHPVVARQRLTKELDDAKKLLETEKADVTKLEDELTRTKKGVEERTARIGEIEKELKGLAAPGGS